MTSSSRKYDTAFLLAARLVDWLSINPATDRDQASFKLAMLAQVEPSNSLTEHEVLNISRQDLRQCCLILTVLLIT